MTHLCVAIFFTDAAGARRDIALAAEAGADMVELRLDQCTDAAQFKDIIASAMLPIIATCRPTWEGGQSELDNAQRAELLAAAVTAGAAYVDVELAAGLPGAWDKNGACPTPARVILSSHDFSGRPDRLYNLIEQMDTSPAGVNKLVWTARSIRDNIEVFELLKTRNKPTIALCMGEAGLISRVLARKFGAFLSFAALDNRGGTAAGQIAVADMKKLYRWDAIGPATKVYGVVAQPVMHSMSPAIHNAAFSATGFDGIYLPLLVEAGYESFKAFMEMFLRLDGLHLSGLSVTLPHKENALRYLREKNANIEGLAQRIGAVNTIIIDRQDGATTLGGINTDYAAILDSITDKLSITRQDLGKYRIAVLGAGGTGRTATAGLAHYGASVTVFNRTVERARELADELTGRTGTVTAAGLDDLANGQFDIYINTTSVGMYPKVDQSPVGDRLPDGIGQNTLVFDTIYNPMTTRLLSQATAAGATTIGGIEMFLRQAVAQFQAWTGHAAPRDVMRQVIQTRLAR